MQGAMARLHGPAGPYHAFEVQFINGGSLGTRLVWAHTWGAARRLICDYPSCFGLTERVLVLRVREIPMVEPMVSDARRAA